jgi:putative transposase
MRHALRQLELRPRTWGGRRHGAGRKPKPGRRAVSHARRGRHDPRCPAHVTLRVCPGVPSLRNERLLPILRNAFRAGSSARFRLLVFSVQADHLHLVVEADEPTGLARGMQGLAIRVAKALNRALARRGSVWGDRYHAHVVRTPREVRTALVYVLNNFRKHVRAAFGLDPYSSAGWFDGWSRAVPHRGAPSPVVAARTWLGRVGWRRGGPIDPDETPRASGCRHRGRESGRRRRAGCRAASAPNAVRR